MPTVFVTGTDTGCGKTHVSQALLQALSAGGFHAAGFKPVAAGCERVDGRWVNEDALALQRASSVSLTYDEVNPVALIEPIAPHLAAARESRVLEVAPLLAAARVLEQKADWLVVEGAGGFLVPLSATESLADLPERAGWPVILVVGMRLGCLNHALLSVEAIGRRCRLLGWVANVLPPEQPVLDGNLATLREQISAPCLGIVRSENPAAAAREIDLETLVSSVQALSSTAA